MGEVMSDLDARVGQVFIVCLGRTTCGRSQREVKCQRLIRRTRCHDDDIPSPPHVKAT